VSPDGKPSPRSLVWNLGSAGLPLVGSFAVSLLIAPYLGEVGFGQYATLVSAATLLLIGGKFGVHAATSRLLSEHEDDPGRWLRAGLLLRGATTVVFAAVGLALTPAWARLAGNPDAAWLVAPVVVSASLLEFSAESLVGLRAFGPLFGQRMGSLLLRLGAVAWVRWGGLGAAAFLAGHAASQLVPALVALGVLWWRLPRGQEPLTPAVRRTWSISLPLALGSASFLVYAHTDRLMLAWFHDAAAVGQFGVARNVLDASMFPLFALAWTVRPALVGALGRDDDAGRETALLAGLRGSVAYAVGAPLLMGLAGPVALVWLYSEEYREAAELLVWMLPILVLRGLGTLIFPGLLAADRQGRYARLMAWTAAINVVANLALIPPLGARGAILGTVVSLVPMTWLGMRDVARAVGPLPWSRLTRRDDAPPV